MHSVAVQYFSCAGAYLICSAVVAVVFSVEACGEVSMQCVNAQCIYSVKPT